MAKSKETLSLKKQANSMRKESAPLRIPCVNANSCAPPGDATSSKANGRSWVAGQSGNPAGRPLGARQKIANQLLEDLREVWAEKGKAILYRLAIDDPARLATIAYGLLPKDIFVRVEDQRAPGNLESIRELLDILEAAGVKDPEDLRARLAAEIGGSVSNPLANGHDDNDK
jgi:hypothetical protein